MYYLEVIEKINEAVAQLHVVNLTTLPSDDQINAAHVRDAQKMLEDLVQTLAKESV